MCEGRRRCSQSLEDVEWVRECVLSQCFDCQNVECAAEKVV